MQTIVTRLRLSILELEELKEFHLKNHFTWPGQVFSTNQNREIWPFVTHGYTAESDRRYIQGLVPLLDYIVDRFLEFRWEGGRFFIKEDGAYYKPDGVAERFLEFDLA
jgi:hypothetical protein